ncbi:MAG: hypothetical protein KUG77_29210 [Nannocystaceae bacterium]|nr:hypothetical protein [Nannocystaceae bacterium]
MTRTDEVRVMLVLALALATAPPPAARPYRAAPRLPPASAREQANPAQLGGPTPATLFINFNGAELNGEREDARDNGTLIGWSGTFEAYGDGMKQTAIMQAVRQDWLPFNATVTDTRPSNGDYTMVMVGPTNFTDGSLGIALLDCANSWTSNNIVFAFHHAQDGFTAAATATTVNQEIAHSYGLEHVNNDADLMYPYNNGADPAFTNSCHQVVEAAGIGILCTEQHEGSCGSADRQNSHAELMRFVGPRPVDVSPPTVRFTAPNSGDEFEVGNPFVLSVDATDNDAVVAVELLAGGELVAVDDAEPFSWEVTGAPPGTYHFEAVAYDAAGNTTTTEILELVVYSSAETDSGSGTDSGGWETEGDTLAFGSTGDDEDSDLPPDAALDRQTIPPGEDPYDPFGGQCDCRTDAPAPSSLWVLFLFAAARRRNATTRI